MKLLTTLTGCMERVMNLWTPVSNEQFQEEEMGKKDEPKCKTCEKYTPHDDDSHTGTCKQDGAREDENATCWWHSDKEKERSQK